MGSGIAQTFAQSGYEVVNIDTFEPALEKAKNNIKKLFDRKVSKGKLTQEQADEICNRITYSENMDKVKGAFLAVEAVPEKIELKKQVFALLDEIADRKQYLSLILQD